MSRALRLGIFIVAALLVLTAGVFLIGSKEFLFTSTYRLNAEFQNVAGLNDGAEVRVAGLHEGTVKRIDLPGRPGQKVRVVMDLKGPTRDVIKKDSLAAIKSEGLVGDKYVEISFGTEDAPKVQSGDTIQSEPPLDISDLVKKTNGLLDAAGSVMQKVDNSAGDLSAITSKINQGRGTIGALINDKGIYQQVDKGVAAFQEDMEALKHNFFLRGFFKKRGYEDSDELTRHEISRIPAKPSTARFAYRAGQIFDKRDTAKLRKEKSLNEAGRFLEDHPFGLAVVAAYSDLKGDTEKDRLLTQARAMVVRDYLVQNFKLDDTRVKTMGAGKSAESNDGGEVAVLVYPPGTAVPQNHNHFSARK